MGGVSLSQVSTVGVVIIIHNCTAVHVMIANVINRIDLSFKVVLKEIPTVPDGLPVYIFYM